MASPNPLTLTPTSPAMPPASCEVLVIGAGPAGSACAQWLARHGVDTVIVDQHDFPRDKTCGDGLIPDAHQALQRLGVLEEVLDQAHHAPHVRCYGPSGRHVDVPGTLAVLPRRELDHILVRAAQRAGAQLHTPWGLEAPVRDDTGRVVGARLRSRERDRRTHEIRARQVVLATGASAQALEACGLSERRSPSAMGLRGYVKNEALSGHLKNMEVVWHSKLKPGYGWIFPCRHGVFNMGVGVFGSHRSGDHTLRDVNLREVFDEFTRLHAPARSLVEGGQWMGPLKGAPLRSSLRGARVAAPGILVTGEAAGSTYSFTGEGIGKAMETGLLAARAIVEARDTQRHDDLALAQRYTAALAVLQPKFDLYEKGNRVNHHPWLTDILVRRASRSPRLRQRMAHLLEERSTPAQLITWRGLVRLFLE
jgi:geranylgeranyl reductase family protein